VVRQRSDDSIVNPHARAVYRPGPEADAGATWDLVASCVDFLSLIERGVTAQSFEVLERVTGGLRLPVRELFDFRRAAI